MIDNRARKAIMTFMMLLMGGIAFFSSTVMATPVDTLQPGHWYEVPNSQLSKHAPSPAFALPGYQTNVMQAWSGGAYDTLRDRLIVWGGGHGDYSGNEIYVFDINTLTWSRINEPSNPSGGDEASGIYTDGNPRSRHSYNYLEYMPNIDRFVSVGSAATYPNGMSQDKKFYDFNFDTLTWNKNRAPAISSGNISSFAVYDPVTGHLFRHGALNSSFGLDEYDPINDTWTKRPGGYLHLYTTAAIDPVNRYLVAVGSGNVPIRWDLSKPTSQPVEFTTVGDKFIEEATAPGFVYDPNTKRFVGWHGGADVFVLNPLDWTWTRVKPAPTNTVIPTAGQKWGTYGRFRYVPSKKVFVTVNQTTGSVYIYKLSNDGSGAWPTISFNTVGSKIVKAGTSATLIWNVTNANTCTATGGWSGSKALSGTETVGPINNDTIYTLTCTGNAGTSASAVSITVDGDVTPPVISEIFTGGDPSLVNVVFNEKVDSVQANVPSNYTISPSISVNSATLQADSKTVVLTTTVMTKDSSYTLLVKNVTDVATPPNQINGTTEYTFQYVGGAASGTIPSNYVWGTLNNGELVYVDRTYTFINASKYQGMEYLKTANDDKYSTGPAFVKFSTNKPLTVYLAYDERNKPIPDWLASWTATGDVIVGSHIDMDVYAKEFPVGDVEIDGNELGNSMYVVIIDSKLSDSEPPVGDKPPLGNPGGGDKPSSGGGGGSFTPLFLMLMALLCTVFLYRKP